MVTQQRTPFGVMQSQQPCPHCGGRGTVIKEPCKTCRGTGMTGARKTLEVRIPAGIDDDQKLRARPGRRRLQRGPGGRCHRTCDGAADPIFQRDGYDVTVRVPITFSQAVLGDDVEVRPLMAGWFSIFRRAPRAEQDSGCAARASSTSTAAAEGISTS